jgi:glutaredoxin 3
MAKVLLYTTRSCSYCLRAKRLLTEKRIAFEEVDVTTDDEKRQWLKATTGLRTVPVIFINDQLVGGYGDLVRFEQSGGLKPLIPESQ